MSFSRKVVAILADKKNQKNLSNALELSGTIKNLLDTDIAMLAGRMYSTFEANGNVSWHGADKPVKMLKVGALNGLFMLMEPTAKISEQEMAEAYEAMSVNERNRLERTLRLETRPKKDCPSRYCIVSKTAAIVARMSCRNLEYMLVPVFKTRLDEQEVHVGFIPARLLFEKLEP